MSFVQNGILEGQMNVTDQIMKFVFDYRLIEPKENT